MYLRWGEAGRRGGGGKQERETDRDREKICLRMEVFQECDLLFGFCLSFSDTLHLSEGVIH